MAEGIIITLTPLQRFHRIQAPAGASRDTEVRGAIPGQVSSQAGTQHQGQICGGEIAK